MTPNLPLDLLRGIGGNLARATRKVVDWIALPRRDRFWLELALRGPVDEMPTLHPAIGRSPSSNLLDVLETLAAAGADPQVAGILLRVTGPLRGLSRILSLRRAVAEVRAQGKPVVVYAEALEIESLLVASAADQIWMPESGSVFVVGLRLESFFLRGVLDRFEIAPEVVSVGRYKSAAEPFIRGGMSPESREQLEALADDLYRDLVDGIADGRGIPTEALRLVIDAGPYRVPPAIDAGLVDRSLYPDEIDDALAAWGDGEASTANPRTPVRRVDATLYHALRGADPGWRPLLRGLPRVAYVVARGTIGRGGSVRGISSEGYGELLAGLRADPRVAGVVLRIDSGGGDALASDLLWREVAVTGREKPVVVSMGDVVASGGYFLASAAHEVFAESATVTGSIGVVGGKVNLAGLYRRIGVAKDTVERGTRAGLLSEGRGFTPDEKRAVRAEMTAVYENFVARVAEGRNLSVDEVRAVAEGRVWSGARAKQVGLVDTIGGPLEALRSVRARAGLLRGQAVIVDRYPRRPRLPGLRDWLRLFPLR